MNPFELTGPAFVALFIAGAVVAVITTAVLARARRGPWDDPDGAARTPLTGPELGWLAGGEVRAATAAAATAVHGGHAEVVDGTLRATTAAALAALDPITARVVATATPSAGIGELARAIARDPASTARLRAAGLWRSPVSRLHHAAPLLAWMAVGASKVMVGVGRGRPVGGLVVLLALLGVLVAIWAPSGRTGRGELALDHARRTADALALTARAAPAQLSPDELGRACALFGASHALVVASLVARPGATGGEATGGCGSGCGSGGGGDGGGCGGGCGGCS